MESACGKQQHQACRKRHQIRAGIDSPIRVMLNNMNIEQVSDVIRSSTLSHHADQLTAHLMPSARILVENELSGFASGAATSHFGGLPCMSERGQWPRWDRTGFLHAQISYFESLANANPRLLRPRETVALIRDELKRPIVPLAFLAQLDLAHLRLTAPLPDWPTEGTVAFFYAWPEDAWDFEPRASGFCRVLNSPPTERVAVMPAPDDLPEEARFPEYAVTFEPEWTLPSSFDFGDDVRLWSSDDDYGAPVPQPHVGCGRGHAYPPLRRASTGDSGRHAPAVPARHQRPLLRRFQWL